MTITQANGDDYDGPDRRRSNGGTALERHIQTAVGVVATAAIIWMGSSLIDLNKEMVRTATQLSQVREDMKQLQDQYVRGTADRYTGAEARRDLGVIGMAVQKLEDRMDRYDREGRRTR